MMEIVMLAEEALPLSISNEELRHLRTLGEIEQFISSQTPRSDAAEGFRLRQLYLDDLARPVEKADCPVADPSNRPAA